MVPARTIRPITPNLSGRQVPLETSRIPTLASDSGDLGAPLPLQLLIFISVITMYYAFHLYTVGGLALDDP